MYACVLIPHEMSLIFALEPPTDLSVSRHADPPHHQQRGPMSMTSSMWSNTALTPGTVFYPDEGEVRLERVADRQIMAQDDIRRTFGCYDVMLRMDGQEVRHCNWVRFVKTTNDPEAANIICSKGRGQPYYQVIKPVKANDEFVVYFNTTTDRHKPSYPAGSTILPSQNFTPFQHPIFYPQPTYLQDGGMSSPLPTMLLRHYDKIMTSTPIPMHTNAKASTNSYMDINMSSRGEPTPVLRHRNSSPHPYHHHHHHHQQKFMSKKRNDSSSLNLSISPSSSFSSPLPKTPNQNEGIDYSISRLVQNESSLSSPNMTSSSLSHDCERTSGDTTHSIPDQQCNDGSSISGSSMNGSGDRYDGSGSGEHCKSFPGLSDSFVCKRDIEDVDVSIKKEPDENEDKSVKVKGELDDDDKGEDDVNVDVDSTGVDLSINCENENIKNMDEVESKIKTENYEDEDRCDSKKSKDSNSKYTTKPHQHSSVEHQDRQQSILQKEGGGCEEVTSELQITSSTARMTPVHVVEVDHKFDQSEEAVDMSHGDHRNQSKSCDLSTEEVCRPSIEDRAFETMKPNAAMMVPIPCDMMTSRDSKPMKRCRERSWWPCEICGKKFDRPSLLKRHIRTHTGEKPHACDVCGKAFSTSSSLNTHRRIHSGEKPHQCKVCGKRFTASSNLYYHRMTHNKEKPHKCTMCSKSFPTPGDLRSHQYIHSGSWPFRCHVCNRGFSKQTNLRNHMMLHSGDKPHECLRCGKKFALLCNLKTHYKTHDSTDSSDILDASKCDDTTDESVIRHKTSNDSPVHNVKDKLYSSTNHRGVSTINGLDSSDDVDTTSSKNKHSKFSKEFISDESKPSQNVRKSKRHTDFSISRITSSDKPKQTEDITTDDVNTRNVSSPEFNFNLSNPKDLMKAVPLTHTPMVHPMYRHFIAAAAASHQQQQQQQRDQLQLQHQQWLLSQHGYNTTPGSIINPAFTTLKDFHKSAISPVASPVTTANENSTSSPFSASSNSHKMHPIQFNTQLAPVPAFFTPEMMSLQRSGTLLPTVPMITSLQALWGNQVAANGF